MINQSNQLNARGEHKQSCRLLHLLSTLILTTYIESDLELIQAKAWNYDEI